MLNPVAVTGLLVAALRAEEASQAFAARDWPSALRESGFDPSAPTLWLVEGLLQYLDTGLVHALFERIEALSTPGSTLLYDVVGETLLTAAPLQPLIQHMGGLGAPWTFGTDQPRALVGPPLVDGTDRPRAARNIVESLAFPGAACRCTGRAPRLSR